MKFFLLFFLISGSATGASLKPMDLDTMLENSRLVVKAQCQKTQTEFKGGHVWTLMQWDVLEWIDGSGPGSIILEIPGGVRGGYTTESGVHLNCIPEKPYILFLSPHNTRFQILGFHSGQFEIEKGSGGEELVKATPQSSNTLVQSRIRLNTSREKQLLYQFLQNPRLSNLKAWIQEARSP